MFEGDKYYGKIKSSARKGRSISSRRNNSIFNPKMEAYLLCLRNHKEVSVIGAEKRGREAGETQR